MPPSPINFSIRDVERITKYTKTRLPVKLLASVDFDNKNDAMSCEWWFKHKLVRKQKLSLIKNDLIKEKFIEYLELKQKKNIHLK